MTALPWIIALGATALITGMGGGKAKAETPKPKPTPKPPEPKFSTQPVGSGVAVQPIPAPAPTTPVKTVPKITLPPIIPPDAVEVENPLEGAEEVITSPGQPVMPIKRPAPAPKPIPIKIPTPEEVVEVIPPEVVEVIPPEVVEVIPEVPGFGTQPVGPGVPVIEVPDLSGVPIDATPIDLDEFEEPTALATAVYNVTVDGIRNLKGSEVRTIKDFQKNEGLKVDGFYGPNTAEALIKYGFVPATPWIWPKGRISAAKKDWQKLTAEHAIKDPQRADEWAESGNV